MDTFTGEPIAAPNRAFLQRLVGFDMVIIAGQAKSHCVAWTIDDLLLDERTPAEKIYVLEDCTSPVVAGELDFTAEADAAFARFAAAGAHVVGSIDAFLP
jgi:nicotinamidase-related amidase